MVNYSIVMRANPMDEDAAKKAYASAQYSEVMTMRTITLIIIHCSATGDSRTSDTISIPDWSEVSVFLSYKLSRTHVLHSNILII